MFGALVAGVTCGDQSPAGLPSRSVAPGHAALSVAPTFARMPDGGPTITLATVTGVLTAANGEKFTVTAHFVDGVATLDFDVTFTGSSADFTLDLQAFDANGVIAFSATQALTLKPGRNTNVPTPVLVYAAPDAAVTTLKVSPATLTLNSGATGGVSATGTNASGQAVAPLRVGWASRDGSVATVDENGAVKAGASQGKTYIVGRTANNKADSAQVIVHAPVAKVTVAPATSQIIRGATVALAGELRDATNILIDDRTPTWTSSDPTVATVAPNGVVTGVKIGTATITATAEGKTATAAITVVTPLDHVELTPGATNLASLKQTVALVTKLVPKQGGSTTGITPTYKSDKPDIATVDASGTVTAVKNGVAVITVTADDLTATTTVTVKQVAQTVSVTPKTVGVNAIGAAATFTATAIDALGSVITGAAFTWTSSDPGVASVVDGTAKALKVGSSTITATTDGKSDNGVFIVSPTVSLLGVYLSKSSIAAGSTAIVSAKYTDAGGTPLGDAPASFSTTTPGIISVSGSTVTGLSAGRGHITAIAGSLTGAIDIIVTGTTGGGSGTLTISPPSAEKLPGSSQDFSVTSDVSGPFTWTVNGIPNGNTTFGTISYGEGGDGSTIRYFAPASVPSPSTFDVCATQSPSPFAFGCAHVTISAIPSGGADVIVVNDMNLFDNSNGVASGGANQSQFFLNLINFTGVGPRVSQKGFMFFHGHNSLCFRDGYCNSSTNSSMYATLTGGGFTVVEVNSTSANFNVPIDPSIKTILLLNPTTPFNDFEINNLKLFASQGGRIVFSGEHGGYYGSYIVPVENDLLSRLGGHLVNASTVVACTSPWRLGAANIHPHQVTTGLTDLAFPCGSGITLGPDDYALFLDPAGGAIVGAVAKIDLTPIDLRTESVRGGRPIKKPAAAARATTIPAAKPSTVDGVNRPRVP